ncbi:chemotaxis protein CheA [Aestuariivirga sp.]|uniref:chemotaxis protein CheA n=1 Tax=Aestuariivirga sp. TaxID=2650926 RepID=UPI003BAC40E1
MIDDLLQQFVVEAGELVQQAADDLLALEHEPTSRPHIESLFRGVHTLKGSAGLFDFTPIQRTLYAAEDILTVANRAGELDLGMVDPLIAIIEWTDRCVREVAVRGALPADAGETGAALTSALATRHVKTTAPAETVMVPEWSTRLFAVHSKAQSAIRYEPRPDCFFNGDDPVALMAAIPQLLAVEVGVLSPWPDAVDLDPFRSNLFFEAASAASRSQIENLFRLLPDQAVLVSRPVSSGAVQLMPHARRTVRVDAARVDMLANIVGELFVAKNAFTGLVNEARQIEGGLALSRAIAAAQEDLDRLSHRLHRAATGVRMVPLNETLRRLPRLVREISTQLGKPVDLQVEGGDVEADKTVVDALFDPLLHTIRNAIDHGIEEISERERRGKPPRGRISVGARQDGFRIEVTISDDGGGVDIAAVRSAAIKKGLITAELGSSLDDDGVIDLLFRSGFSTAGNVSDVSGRGVGMDSVRRDVQALGGHVTLESENGQGVTLRLSLPTRIALTRIIIVTCDGGRYALPMDAIIETLRIDARAINKVRAGEAMIVRGRTVPVVRLATLLGRTSICRGHELLLIANVGGAAIGLVIDSIGERLEAMLRPATGLIKIIPGISGTTVLGDGSVALVLDLEALIT